MRDRPLGTPELDDERARRKGSDVLSLRLRSERIAHATLVIARARRGVRRWLRARLRTHVCGTI
jgi:hypothetical protein